MSPNGTKAQIDYIIVMDLKWRDVQSFRSFNTFEGVQSDQLSVTSKIRFSIRANMKKASCNVSNYLSTLEKT